ncbi:hypothetical protein GCM10011487_21340 [Steroidobacter agaridevorans]|uniref:Uncharacterized protein n=1 Tax=Steroidobacter agaridevorans TaxID=2695856 RepID=A0A829Y9W4_9GAMM|nr:hypothetical protein [Steroidobacter agaridevorans]GFE80134.1 hypothetical protein GCM10011487_21340 [Steroidobacter agaridevorans]
MQIKWAPAVFAIGLASVAAIPRSQANETTLERMPAALETQFALSAVPPALRERASVYLLDPAKGYSLSKQGTSSLTCIVQRTAWEYSDFRNDIYWPVCYDAAGTKMHLKVIMDAAALRAQGMGPEALKAEISKRYRERTYKIPEKSGLSYMVGPVMRAAGPPDMKVRTMAMPHLMFYAPFVTNEEIGATPDFTNFSSLKYPFIDQHGIPEQSYVIQLIGEAETNKILADEAPLIDALCAYRDVLCLAHEGH